MEGGIYDTSQDLRKGKCYEDRKVMNMEIENNDTMD